MEQLFGTRLKKFNKHQNKSLLEIVLVLENLQYARNVAEIFRIADASKVSEIILTGISPTPPFGKDLQKVSRSKEKSVKWRKMLTTGKALEYLIKNDFVYTALEITDSAQKVTDFALPVNNKLALIIGNEVYGLKKETLAKISTAVFIPMFGKGASMNVSVATAICIYTLLFKSFSYGEKN